MDAIRRVQTVLADAKLYLGKIDGDAGPGTAGAYASALRAGLTLDPALVEEVRAIIAGGRPRQSQIQILYGPQPKILESDPARPGWLRFQDGHAWFHEAIREYDVPLIGRKLLHKRAAGCLIFALADVESQTDYRPGIACTWALRHMNRDPRQPLSTHCGWAVDLDLDQDGKWERIEDMRAVPPEVVPLMEAWGIVWGGRWRRSSQDDMHFQAARTD